MTKNNLKFGLHAVSIWMQNLIFDNFLALKNFNFYVKAVNQSRQGVDKRPPRFSK